MTDHALGLLFDFSEWTRERAQRRQFLFQTGRIRVELQYGFERGKRHLVHAQSALHRVFLDALYELLAPDYEPSLRSAEKFVAAEGDDIGAVRKRFARRRLVRESVFLQIDEHAAAQVHNERHSTFTGELRQIRFSDRRRKPLYR